MKSLSKRISQTSKSALLYSLLFVSIGAFAQASKAPISSDRFLLKVLDRTVSVQDIGYQLRNLQALYCVFDDAIIVRYFDKDFIPDLKVFMKKLPEKSEDVRTYLHGHEEMLKKLRIFFKMLRYSEDQKGNVSTELMKLVRASSKENKCGTDVLYKDTLKTNFLALLQLELYLRSRYGNQLKNAKNFNEVRASIDLFVESLDKQFPHEYYW